MARLLRIGALLLAIVAWTAGTSSLGFCEWQQVALDGHQVNGLAFRPGDSDTAFAAVYYNNRGVYKSTDGGENWTLVGSLAWADDIAIDPIDREVLYVICVDAIWRSLDGGASWQPKDDEFDFIAFDYGPADIVVDPLYPDTVYVTTAAFTGGGGLYRSADRGEHWYSVETPWLSQKGAMAIDPLSSVRMYLAVRWNGPLGRTLDACSSWDGVLSAVVNDIAVNPHDPDIVFAAAELLYRSQDGGDSWTAFGPEDGLPEPVTAVAINSVNPAIVFAAGQTHVFKSTDGGTSWNDFSEGLPEGTYISSLAVDGEYGETLLLGTYGDGIYRRNSSIAGIANRTRGLEDDPIRIVCTPNPMAGQARVSFVLREEGEVRLTVYDVSGRAIQTLVESCLPSGEHTTAWSGTDAQGRPIAPGLYFLEVSTPRGRYLSPAVYLR